MPNRGGARRLTPALPRVAQPDAPEVVRLFRFWTVVYVADPARLL